MSRACGGGAKQVADMEDGLARTAPDEIRRGEPILRRLRGRGELAAEFCQSQDNAADRVSVSADAGNAGWIAITPQRADKPAAGYVNRRHYIQ